MGIKKLVCENHGVKQYWTPNYMLFLFSLQNRQEFSSSQHRPIKYDQIPTQVPHKALKVELALTDHIQYAFIQN